jgi:hypothetical protein
MRIKRIFFMGGISTISVIVCLLLIAGIAQSQCIPGSKGSEYGGHEGYWLSSGSGKVPFALWAPAMKQYHPSMNDYYANVEISYEGWCEWEDWTGAYEWWPCEAIYQCANDPCLSMGTLYTWTCKIYCYTDFDMDPGTSRDYDCDVTFDSQDANPGTPDLDANANKGIPGCDAQAGR